MNEKNQSTMNLDKHLFTFMRIFSLIAIVVCAIGIICLLFFALSQGKSNYVTYGDVVKNIKQNMTADEALKKLDNISPKISPQIEKYMGDENIILEGWLSEIEGEKQKKAFLKNMEDIIVKAEKDKKNVTDCINKYHLLCSEKETTPFDKYEQQVKIGGAIAGIAVFCLLIMVFILTLVAIAIEKNTRINLISQA